MPGRLLENERNCPPVVLLLGGGDGNLASVRTVFSSVGSLLAGDNSRRIGWTTSSTYSAGNLQGNCWGAQRKLFRVQRERRTQATSCCSCVSPDLCTHLKRVNCPRTSILRGRALRCSIRAPKHSDPDVAGTSPVKEKDVGVTAARLLSVGDTDENSGTDTSTWYSLRAKGNRQAQIETHCIKGSD